jgi:hypothetical protein
MQQREKYIILCKKEKKRGARKIMTYNISELRCIGRVIEIGMGGSVSTATGEGDDSGRRPGNPDVKQEAPVGRTTATKGEGVDMEHGAWR